jgi:hypothetical protein
MADKKTKTWVSIVIGAIVVGAGLILALVGGSAYFVARHVGSQFVSTDAADAQFASARDRFAGQTALIELRKDADPIVHRQAEDAHAAPIQIVRVMAYSPDSRKLVNVSLPMWLLRMAPGSGFSRLSGNLDDKVDFGSREVHLTLEDIERRGPGLILDETDRRGVKVLVWAE